MIRIIAAPNDIENYVLILDQANAVQTLLECFDA